MSFTEKLYQAAENLSAIKDKIKNEEATKNSLVLPFINTLGYNIFNPTEVMPEYTADVGMKKKEKVDYAICVDGKPVILFECKWCQNNLSNANASQLRRYFQATSARIGILTNGIKYQFFSDLDKANIMDNKPFMELDLENIEDSLINEVKKLSKADFEIDVMLSTANDLKYTRQIKALLRDLFENPTPAFVRFFAAQVYEKKLFPAVMEQFTTITKKALKSFINSQIDQRLKSALSNEISAQNEVDDDPVVINETGVVTTDDELEGYYIVKAILTEKIQPDRIYQRDTKSYFGILLDDNNRKPVCRLRFNTSQKYIGLFDTDKNEVKHPIEKVSDIYQFSAQLKETLSSY